MRFAEKLPTGAFPTVCVRSGLGPMSFQTTVAGGGRGFVEHEFFVFVAHFRPGMTKGPSEISIYCFTTAAENERRGSAGSSF